MPEVIKNAYALTAMQVAQYHHDGFLLMRNLFSADELEPLRQAYREDPTINGRIYGMEDLQGKGHPICSWTELGDDIIGMIPRMARMVDCAEALLGEECYHWHSKFSIKSSTCAARVDWHQDFASWHDDGVLFPDMLTVGLAIEPANRANGCLQLIPGSHRMGRIEYETFDARLNIAIERLSVTHVEMEVGDAVFFHSNTLHGSGLNETDSERVMVFVTYNARSNTPLAEVQGKNVEGAFMGIGFEERAYRPIEKLDDDVLSRCEFKSAFSHSPLHEPRLDLDSSYGRAVKLDQ